MRFFRAWARRRRNRRHAPTSLSDAMRDSQGPMMRYNVGAPRTLQHDVVADSHERYKESFDKNA